MPRIQAVTAPPPPAIWAASKDEKSQPDPMTAPTDTNTSALRPRERRGPRCGEVDDRARARKEDRSAPRSGEPLDERATAERLLGLAERWEDRRGQSPARRFLGCLVARELPPGSWSEGAERSGPSGAGPVTSFALILIAFTALVAPVCSTTATSRRRTANTRNVCDPSITMARRPRKYGGEQTAAPTAPPIAEAVSLSRRDRFDLAPRRREGISTYVSIMMPTTIPRDRPNQRRPHRWTTMVENPRARPIANPQPSTVLACARASENAGRMSGFPGLDMANAKTALRK